MGSWMILPHWRMQKCGLGDPYRNLWGKGGKAYARDINRSLWAISRLTLLSARQMQPDWLGFRGVNERNPLGFPPPGVLQGFTYERTSAK